MTASSIYNIQNEPIPQQEYFYFDENPNAEEPVLLPASRGTLVYWAQDEFSFDITFTVFEVIEEGEGDGGLEEDWVVTNTVYNGMTYGDESSSSVGDFFSGTPFSSVGNPEQIDSVSVLAIENPFDEYYDIVQTYGDGQGSIDKRFNEEAAAHEAETDLDKGFVDLNTFSYLPPEDETFVSQANTYESTELSDFLDEGAEQSKFLGVSKWELPEEQFYKVIHSFTITAVGQTSGNEITIPYTVYHESHWNFDKARVFAERLQNEEAILNANDTDITLEDAESVDPDIPEYDLDTEFVTDYFPDVETQTQNDDVDPIDTSDENYDPDNLEWPTGVDDIEDPLGPQEYPTEPIDDFLPKE